MHSNHKFLCEPENYNIEIVRFSYGMAVVLLTIVEKDTAYQHYHLKHLNYDEANNIVKQFCEDLEKGNFKSYVSRDDIFSKLATNGLKKVTNKLGLKIWQRKKQ